MTYSGNYASQRYSLLHQVDLTNVKDLELKWVFQAQSLQKFEATPLVVDGIMYITQSPNDVIALDAKTGAVHSGSITMSLSPAARPCCGSRESRRGNPRRYALHGDRRCSSGRD